LLLGLAVQVRSLPAEEWPGIVDAARRAGCLRRLIVALSHACRVLGLDPPCEIATILEADCVTRAFVGSLAPESLADAQQRNRRQHLTWLLWTLGMEDSPRDNVAHTLARLIRPGPDDWASVQLPAHIEWLYYPLRPVRLCARLVRGTAHYGAMQPSGR